MCKKKNEGGETAAKTDKLYRLVLKTPLQRKLMQRNNEISVRFQREVARGSATMGVYDHLAKIYGLTSYQIANICREGVRYA